MPDKIRRQLTKGYFSGRTVCDRDRKAGDNKRCFIAIKIFSVLVVIVVLETMRAMGIAHIWSIQGRLVD